MIGTASFDRSQRYRYTLTRTWDAEGDRLAFVMLNPSRANAKKDDPTIRRCIRFARDWGYGSLEVVNLFAWRATDPAALRRARDPIGPRCNLSIRRAAQRADVVVAAWGVHGTLMDRDRILVDAGQRASLIGVCPVVCLGLTRDGHPRHPLFVPAARRSIPFP